MSNQTSTKAPAPAPVVIQDAAKLPGAFLFFRFTTPNGNFAGISYDPTITSKTTLKQLQEKYILQNTGTSFPYIETFAPIPTSVQGTKIWQGANQVNYAGVFGGPDPVSTDKTPQPKKSRISFSPVWPWAGAQSTSLIRDGVYVSFWYYGSNTGDPKGMHTSSISKHFDGTNPVPYMFLQKGQPDFNLVPQDYLLLRNTVTGVYLDWYATLENKDFNWSAENNLRA